MPVTASPDSGLPPFVLSHSPMNIGGLQCRDLVAFDAGGDVAHEDVRVEVDLHGFEGPLSDLEEVALWLEDEGVADVQVVIVQDDGCCDYCGGCEERVIRGSRPITVEELAQVVEYRNASLEQREQYRIRQENRGRKVLRCAACGQIAIVESGQSHWHEEEREFHPFLDDVPVDHPAREAAAKIGVGS